MRESTNFIGKRNKGWKPDAFCSRQKIRKNSRLCGREFLCLITI